jgi:Rps23 Pro-64 3,4-dihydroxylase Tpa1-like proline 4-hydroxylase
MDINSIINPKHTSPEAIKAWHDKFDNAVPYRHIVIEDFFNDDVADKLYNNFPQIDSLNVKRKSLNENKSEDYHFDRWDPIFSEVREVIKSEEWCKIMTQLTGIEDLKTTMDALGSGVHQGQNGSYVDVHVDVNMNPQANLWRRINLLVYLNKNWQPEYGGDLEVWDKDMKKMYNKVSPTFNRALIFYTDDNSPHGYNKINVPEGESRKSFYTYFYTELGKDFKYRDSKFISRPDDSKARKLATTTKETLKIKGKQFLKALGIRSLDFQDKNK